MHVSVLLTANLRVDGQDVAGSKSHLDGTPAMSVALLQHSIAVGANGSALCVALLPGWRHCVMPTLPFAYTAVVHTCLRTHSDAHANSFIRADYTVVQISWGNFTFCECRHTTKVSIACRSLLLPKPCPNRMRTQANLHVEHIITAMQIYPCSICYIAAFHGGHQTFCVCRTDIIMIGQQCTPPCKAVPKQNAYTS